MAVNDVDSSSGFMRIDTDRQRPSSQQFIAGHDSPSNSDLHESADRHNAIMALLLERRLCLTKHIPRCDTRIFCTRDEASEFHLDTPQGMRRLKRAKGTSRLQGLFSLPTA